MTTAILWRRVLVRGRATALAAALAAGAISLVACDREATPDMPPGRKMHPAPAPDVLTASVIPPDSAIPRDSLGASMRRGLALFTQTGDSLPGYVGANLRCFSCHLDGGRRPLFSLVGAFVRYPRYVDRSGSVATIEDRINFCFTRSLAGRPLSVGSREMRDMVSYLAFLSRGIAPGAHVQGEGTPGHCAAHRRLGTWRHPIQRPLRALPRRRWRWDPRCAGSLGATVVHDRSRHGARAAARGVRAAGHAL